MKQKFTHKLLPKVLILVALFTLAGALFPSTISAQQTIECADGTTIELPSGSMGGVTAEDACVNNSGHAQEDAYNLEQDCKNMGTNEALNADNCKIVKIIHQFINVLSGLVGVVIVIMIAVGGIQYSTARDDPQAAAGAKQKIRNAIFALLIYLFAFAFLQWLVPGGVL